MKRKLLLSKELVYEHCATMPNKSFNAYDVEKSLKADGIKGFRRGALNQHFLTLVKENRLQRIHPGRYSVPKTFDQVETKVDAEVISTAELGKSIVAYIELLKNENKELKERLGEYETVNIRNLTEGKL